MPSFEQLLGILEGRDHWARVEAISALGALGDGRALSPLSAVLEDERECRHTKAEAARALARLEMAEAGEALMRALEHDEDVEVRTLAAEALGRLRVVSAARVLRRVAAREKDRDLVAAARRALEQLSLKAVP